MKVRDLGPYVRLTAKIAFFVLMDFAAILLVAPAMANPRSQLAPGEAVSWPTPCPPTIQCPSGYDAVTSPDGLTTINITGGAPGSPGGALVLQGPNVSWSSGTQGAVVALMQADGDFVAYDITGRQIWSSGTSGNPGAFLRVDPSEVSIITPSNKIIWRETYTLQGQCQAAMHEAQVENLKVILDPSDLAAFATALKDPTVAQCEANVLAAATASLPMSACTIAESMPLDPANSPKQAVTAAFQQAESNSGGQFYGNCYSPYIAALDNEACRSFCDSASNLSACKLTSYSECQSKCFGSSIPQGCAIPIARNPQIPSPFGQPVPPR
jgi:hypothetical protein